MQVAYLGELPIACLRESVGDDRYAGWYYLRTIEFDWFPAAVKKEAARALLLSRLPEAVRLLVVWDERPDDRNEPLRLVP
jgi:hypothetical protein